MTAALSSGRAGSVPTLTAAAPVGNLGAHGRTTPMPRTTFIVPVLALLGLLAAAGCRSDEGPKWVWKGRLTNAAEDIAVVEVEGFSYDVPKAPGEACLYLRVVHRPDHPPGPEREVVVRATCETGGVRRSDETTLLHGLAPPNGTIFNLFTHEPLPGRPTTCQLTFQDRLWFPEDATPDPLGALCVDHDVVREGPCPGFPP